MRKQFLFRITMTAQLETMYVGGETLKHRVVGTNYHGDPFLEVEPRLNWLFDGVTGFDDVSGDKDQPLQKQFERMSLQSRARNASSRRRVPPSASASLSTARGARQ